jgi:heterodisulfide reductase subunit B
MIKYIYYPGCSQKSSAISYDRSFLAVCKVLGIELIELEDWNCCGTTIAISVSKMVSSFLAARNLGLANQYKLPVVTPCPSCYVSLRRILKESKENKTQFDRVNELMAEENLAFSTDTEVYHSLEFLVSVVGLDTIANKVRNPLSGYRIAPYYGCQLVSPYANGNKSEDPQHLEKLIKVLGALPVNFSFRTLCCGGSLMFTLKEQAKKLSSMILDSIQRTNANLIVTPCGLCQLNLEMARNRSLPIINIGQMVGLALGLDPGKLYMNKIKIPAMQGIPLNINEN